MRDFSASVRRSELLQSLQEVWHPDARGAGDAPLKPAPKPNYIEVPGAVQRDTLALCDSLDGLDSGKGWVAALNLLSQVLLSLSGSSDGEEQVCGSATELCASRAHHSLVKGVARSLGSSAQIDAQPNVATIGAYTNALNALAVYHSTVPSERLPSAEQLTSALHDAVATAIQRVAQSASARSGSFSGNEAIGSFLVAMFKADRLVFGEAQLLLLQDGLLSEWDTVFDQPQQHELPENEEVMYLKTGWLLGMAAVVDNLQGKKRPTGAVAATTKPCTATVLGKYYELAQKALEEVTASSSALLMSPSAETANLLTSELPPARQCMCLSAASNLMRTVLLSGYTEQDTERMSSAVATKLSILALFVKQSWDAHSGEADELCATMIANATEIELVRTVVSGVSLTEFLRQLRKILVWSTSSLCCARKEGFIRRDTPEQFGSMTLRAIADTFVVASNHSRSSLHRVCGCIMELVGSVIPEMDSDAAGALLLWLSDFINMVRAAELHSLVATLLLQKVESAVSDRTPRRELALAIAGAITWAPLNRAFLEIGFSSFMTAYSRPFSGSEPSGRLASRRHGDNIDRSVYNAFFELEGSARTSILVPALQLIVDRLVELGACEALAEAISQMLDTAVKLLDNVASTPGVDGQRHLFGLLDVVARAGKMKDKSAVVRDAFEGFVKRKCGDEFFSFWCLALYHGFTNDWDPAWRKAPLDELAMLTPSPLLVQEGANVNGALSPVAVEQLLSQLMMDQPNMTKVAVRWRSLCPGAPSEYHNRPKFGLVSMHFCIQEVSALQLRNGVPVKPLFDVLETLLMVDPDNRHATTKLVSRIISRHVKKLSSDEALDRKLSVSRQLSDLVDAITSTSSEMKVTVLKLIKEILGTHPDILWSEATLTVSLRNASGSRDSARKLADILKKALRMLLKRAPYYTRSLLHQYLLNHPNATGALRVIEDILSPYKQMKPGFLKLGSMFGASLEDSDGTDTGDMRDAGTAYSLDEHEHRAAYLNATYSGQLRRGYKDEATVLDTDVNRNGSAMASVLWEEDQWANVIDDIRQKSNVLGQVRARFEAVMDLDDVDRRNAFLDIEMGCLKKMQAAVDRSKLEGGTWTRDEQAAHHRAAAMLSLNVRPATFQDASENLQGPILQMLCTSPIVAMSSCSVQTGVEAWSWVVSCRPELTSVVFTHLLDGLVLSAELKKGIFDFSGEGTPQLSLAPLLISRSYFAPNASAAEHAMGQKVDELWAQRRFMFFVMEMCEIDGFRTCAECIAHALHRCLAKWESLNSHPHAYGIGLIIVILSLRVAQHVSTSFECIALQKQAILFGLGLFISEQCWLYHPEPGLMRELLMEDDGLSVDLIELLEPLTRSGSATHLASILTSLLKVNRVRKGAWMKPLASQSGAATDSVFMILHTQLTSTLDYAWKVSPALAYSIAALIPGSEDIHRNLKSWTAEKSDYPNIQALPQAIPYLITEERARSNDASLSYLPLWAPCSIATAVGLLKPELIHNEDVAHYALRVLASYPASKVTFYATQLVQALRYDATGLVEDYLVQACEQDAYFAHRVVWILEGEEAPPQTTEETVKRSGWVDPWLDPNDMWDISARVRDRIVNSFSGDARAFYEEEFSFINEVCNVSGNLYPFSKAERKDQIAVELRKIQVSSDRLYIPFDPSIRIVGIQTEKAIPLQSAAKVPILVNFDVEVDSVNTSAQGSSQPHEVVKMTKGCIFKVGDDCRQDLLALQLIELCRDILNSVGLELWLDPYGVIPTGYERGIIQVIPRCKSRTQLGELHDGGLPEIYRRKFGPEYSDAWKKARHNLIVSLAGYAIVSYLLWSKDRHNGNIMINDDGHIIHIDFGFILEISPGGNLGFETAAFKLSHEMTQLVDPQMNKESPTFKYFQELCVRGYLAVRQHRRAIVDTVQLMKDSKLPCFGRGHPVENLEKRFHPEMNDVQAAAFMRRTVLDAYDKWTTGLYDVIQYMQQGIQH